MLDRGIGQHDAVGWTTCISMNPLQWNFGSNFNSEIWTVPLTRQLTQCKLQLYKAIHLNEEHYRHIIATSNRRTASRSRPDRSSSLFSRRQHAERLANLSIWEGRIYLFVLHSNHCPIGCCAGGLTWQRLCILKMSNSKRYRLVVWFAAVNELWSCERLTDRQLEACFVFGANSVRPSNIGECSERVPNRGTRAPL